MAKTAHPVSPVVNEPAPASQDVQILTVAKDAEADEAVESDRDISKAAVAQEETVNSTSGKTQEQPVGSGDTQRDSVTENVITAREEKPASVLPTPVAVAINEDTDLSEVSQPLHVDVGSHGVELPSVAVGDARRASSESVEVKMKVRGDLVVVGSCSSDSASPSTDSVISSSHKGTSLIYIMYVCLILQCVFSFFLFFLVIFYLNLFRILLIDIFIYSIFMT